MAACETCWGDAYARARILGGTVVDHYYALLAERDCRDPSRVHNHPPHRPVCNERTLPDGQLRGACLSDDGAPREYSSDECGCLTPHARWCAWNGPCCDDCTHDGSDHTECCP